LKGLKSQLSIVITIAIIISISPAAFAAGNEPVVKIFQESTGMAGVYKLVADVKYPAAAGLIKTFYISMSFDNTVIAPVARTTGEPIIGPLTNQRTPFNTSLAGGIVANPALWNEGSARTRFEISAYDIEGIGADAGITAMEFYFKLAGGKTANDVKDGAFDLAEGMDGKIYVGTVGATGHFFYGKTGEADRVNLESFTYAKSGGSVNDDKNGKSGKNSAGNDPSGGSADLGINDNANESWDNPFLDVRESDWFYDAVKYVFGRGLMLGTAADKFDCNMTLNRAMIVTILYRYSGSPNASSIANPFSDVLNNQWYTDAVKWASANKIVLGYGDGRFGTNDAVTNEQLAALIYRMQQSSGKAPPETQAGLRYPDSNLISAWAQDAVNALSAQGVFQDLQRSNFNPQTPATRAEVASMLYRF